MTKVARADWRERGEVKEGDGREREKKKGKGKGNEGKEEKERLGEKRGEGEKEILGSCTLLPFFIGI